MRTAAAAFSALLLASCATPALVMQSKPEGTSARYALPPEQAKAAARQVLLWHGTESIQEIPEQGLLMAVVPLGVWGGMGAWGSTNLVGVWVEPSGDGGSLVTVVSRRRDGGLYTALREETFHEDLQAAVAIIGSGLPLPSVKPGH